MMKRRIVTIVALTAALALATVATGCKKLEARDNLNKGVQAFRNAKYADAVNFFKTAVELDPTYAVAQLYLATAYMSQYIPGANSPENLEYAKSAMENFEKVLVIDPKNASAVESIASLHIQMSQGLAELSEKVKKLDEAKAWYQKLTQVDPQNKTAYYSQGFIVWGKWYPALMEARAKMGMKPEDPGPLKDKKVRAELRDQYLAMINDGIKNLDKALEIDKEYDDAMAYLNLLYRERADLAETVEEYNRDTDTADRWVEKTLQTKKIKVDREQKKSGGGIVSEQSK
jgi:tetratricopeptide (TPR) repeat protein